MPVDAVITGVDLSAGKPLPEGGFTGVERGVPVLVPRQHLRVFLKAIREILLTESLVYIGIGQIRLADEFSGRIVQFLLPPVDCNLGFGGLTHHVGIFTNIRHIQFTFHVSENIFMLRSLSPPAAWPAFRISGLPLPARPPCKTLPDSRSEEHTS